MGVRSPLLATGLVAALFSIGLFGGAWAGNAAANRLKGPYAKLELFARTLSIIENDYVDPRDPEELIEDAIEGMLEDLDPHSTWMSPEEYRSLLNDTQGEYEGIGVEVRPVDTGILVSRVLDNSPAATAGLMTSDIITHIENEAIVGLSLDEVSERLKGPRGTKVLLTIQRSGQKAFSVTATRDKVDVPAIQSQGLPNQIAYIRLIQFQRGCAEELTHAFKSLKSDGFGRGLILDLRDNPGGLLEESIAVADLFLSDGVIVTTKSRIEGEKRYEATSKSLSAKLPIVLLVNGMSASASEIVAGALQDRKRAHVIGTHTYGKGSVQTLYENTDMSALKLTIGRYYTPSGEPVAPLNGRTPDEIVELKAMTSKKLALKKKVEALSIASETEKSDMLRLLADLEEPQTNTSVSWSAPLEERLQTDTQLRRALTWFEKN